MKEKIIEISDRVSKYSNEELEKQLDEVHWLYERGFDDILTLTEFNIITSEIIKRQSTKG